MIFFFPSYQTVRYLLSSAERSDMTNVGEKYTCENCGGVVLVIEPGLPLYCCGHLMKRINEDGTVEASKEIPVISEVDLY